MSKICFDENNIKRLKHLKSIGYPDSSKIPMEIDEVKALRIGTACYIISNGCPSPRLMMFLGYFENVGLDKVSAFCFCCDKGEYKFKTSNIGETYNVFRIM